MSNITTRTYCPRSGSVPARVIAYFQKNLSAKLTNAELAMKFEIDAKNTSALLSMAIEAGFIARSSGYYTAGDDIDQAPDYGSVAQADATIKAAASAPGAAHSPFAHVYKGEALAAPNKRASPSKQPLPDLAVIALDDDVPLARVRPAAPDWATLFDRMQAGQSCALPKAAGHTLRKATQEQHKLITKRFAVKKISDTEIRVWRTA